MIFSDIVFQNCSMHYYYFFNYSFCKCEFGSGNVGSTTKIQTASGRCSSIYNDGSSERGLKAGFDLSTSSAQPQSLED